MRFGPDDSFWVVVDPTSQSQEDDIVFRASLRQLELQFKGGLTMERNVTLFTEKNEAEVEAFGRLTAMRASQAISERLRRGEVVDLPIKIEVTGANGEVLYETILGEHPRQGA
jgi:hypothetical protein